MKLTDARNEIATEIRYVVGQMKKSGNAQGKVYYFSAAYGVIHRIMNHVKDPEMILIDMVLTTSYNMINGRIVAMSQGQETTVSLPPNLFSRLEDSLGQLADAIEGGKKTYPLLETIANLGYSTTGNGYYLYSKGLIEI